MHETRTPAAALWPPDDTEESVLGSHLHQATITNGRTGVNEAATALAGPGGAAPFQAGSQTLITGLRRRGGLPLRVLPDVFVYPRPFDVQLQSMALGRHGPPALIIEVLSEDTWEQDVDLVAGKPWSYADAGVAEYLTLDPTSSYLGEQGRGWRLAGRAYAPWAPDAQGRWASALGISLGFEGLWLVVYGADERPIPREGQILRSLAEREALGEVRGEALGRLEGQRAMLRRLLARRFGGATPLDARLEAVADAETLERLADAVLDAPDLPAFATALERLST